VIAYERLGDLEFDAGRAGAAEGLHRQALRLAEGRAESDPVNPDHQRALATFYQRLGDTACATERVEDAQRFYRRALRLAEDLAESEPTKLAYRRDESVACEKLGDLARDEGRLSEAEELYRQSLQLTEEVARSEPTNLLYQQDLAESYMLLADLALNMERPEEAMELYWQSFDLCQQLTEADPANHLYRHTLASLCEWAVSVARTGDSDLAKMFADSALSLRRGIHELEQEREDFAVEYAYALYLSSEVETTLGHLDTTRNSHSEIIRILQPFSTSDSLGPRGQALLEYALEQNKKP
jgi:tetratricopeptide (TPR) repeat protein